MEAAVTADEIAQRFHARKQGRNYRAKCPVHRSKGLTLTLLTEGARTTIYCHAGCDEASILAAVGLEKKHLFYAPLVKLTREERIELRRKQREEEAAAYRKRIRRWIDRFKVSGYGSEQYASDVMAATAGATALAGGATGGDADRWKRILSTAMERVAAYDILLHHQARRAQ